MGSRAIFEVAVIGLGAMGSATLYQLARRGVRAVGIDRFHPPHDAGSSHGETRITRRANGEGDAYGPPAIRSHELWREIEADAGAALLTECGALIIAPRGDAVVRRARTQFLQRTQDLAARFGIAHEILDAAEIHRRYPQFLVRDEEIAYYEPGGGYVYPERCISAQLDRAQARGAEIRPGTRVHAIGQAGDHVHIATEGGDLLAGYAVVSAGAWAGPLLGPPFDRLLKPICQTLHWFAVAGAGVERWRQGPVFSWSHGPDEDDFFYGFPCLPWGDAVKTSGDRYHAAVDPDHLDRVLAAGDPGAMHARHVAARLADVTARAVRSATCLYTVTPDSHFLIDRHPRQERILVVSPCSGHGFKHSPAIGEAVAELILQGRSTIDLSAFSLARFPQAAAPALSH